MTSHSRSSPQVHQIKAIFEGYRNAMDRPSHHSRGKSSTNVPITDASSKLLVEQSFLDPKPTEELADSIETVIDNKERPKLNQKPSWIGRPAPSRSEHTHVANTMQKVNIEYQAPGLQPPVFVTTSLSKPEWDILEMKSVKQTNGELLFHIEFEAEEGEYQYKFRLGPGDWWVCDEDQPTVDDDLGNRNNILHVSRAETVSKHDEPASKDLRNESATRTAAMTAPNAPVVSAPNHSRSDSAFDHDKSEGHPDDDWDAEPPLLKHEKTYPGQIDIIPEDTVFSSPSSSSKSDLEEYTYPEADTHSPHLHHFPTHHSGIIEELGRAYKRDVEKQAGDTHQTGTLRRHGSGTVASPSLAKVQEEAEDIVMIVSEDEDEHPPEPVRASTPTPYHRHPQHGVHHHHHPPVAEEDMDNERKINTTELQPRGGLSMLGDVFFGAIFAVAVAIIAVVLYSTGSLRQQDTVEDGGAVLGG